MTEPTTMPGRAADRAPASIGANLARGMAMGTADVIPGVSGGTVALILGIYRRLIGAIRSLASAGTALARGNRGRAGDLVKEVPWAFVLAVGSGMVLALGIGSVVLPPLLETYPAQTHAIFFGMIVASLAVPWAESKDGPQPAAGVRWGVAAVAAIAAFLITGLPEAAVEHPALWRVFLSASVAICAMILPGVSGAFLLLALGVYEPTLEAASDLNLPYMLTFMAGAVVGLGVFSKLLHHLLENQLAITMAALTGLMLGALRVLWPWGEGSALAGPPDAASALLALALAAAGFAVVRLLLRFGRVALDPS